MFCYFKRYNVNLLKNYCRMLIRLTFHCRYYQQNRYEYRPGAGAGAGGYDQNEYRQNYQEYRGNGYDNRSPMYFMKNGNRGGSAYGNRDGYDAYDGEAYYFIGILNFLISNEV